MTNQKSYVLIASSIFLIAILLAQNNLPRAFAIDVLTVFPTGSGLTSTSDCGPIQVSGAYVWLQCSGSLNVFRQDDFTFVDDIAQSAGINEDRLLACVIGNCVYFKDTSNDITKYTVESGVITATGFINPACGSLGDGMNYDVAGFIWVTCTATDQVVRINPATNTVTFTSADLTDAVGFECDSPDYVYYEPVGDIGVIMCDTSNNIVTFNLASTLLDSVAITFDGADSIVVDTNNKRIMVLGTGFSGIDTWLYDNAGAMTASTQNIGSTSDYFGCYIEPILFSEVIMGCQGTSGQAVMFLTNTTLLFEIANILETEVPTLVSEFGVGMDLTDSIWYFAGGSNNPSWTQIENVPRGEQEPEPPGGGGGGIPADCNPPFVDTNSDGVCDNPAFAGGGGQNVTDIADDFFCTIGIIPCANGDAINPDIKTNGIGYLLFLIMLIVFMALATLAVEGKKTSNVHIMLYAVVLIGTAGFSAVVGWVGFEIFYVTILAVIALGAVKITTLISGQR